jgi:hypothetical protein
MYPTLRVSAASLLVLVTLALQACVPIGFQCVAEGTAISTPTGPRPVQDIRPRDLVLSRAPSGRVEPCRVTRAVSTVASATLLITLADGRTLRVTATHPIATPTGWRAAGELSAGETVQTDADTASVASIETLHQRVRVYDLTVAGNENFFAGGILVHNKSVIPSATLEQMAGEWDVLSEWWPARVLRIELDESGHGRAVGPGTWRREGNRSVPELPCDYSVTATVEDGRFRIVLNAGSPDEERAVLRGRGLGSYHGTEACDRASEVEIRVGRKGEDRYAAIMRRPGEITESIHWVEDAAATAPPSPDEPSSSDVGP